MRPAGLLLIACLSSYGCEDCVYDPTMVELTNCPTSGFAPFFLRCGAIGQGQMCPCCGGGGAPTTPATIQHYRWELDGLLVGEGPNLTDIQLTLPEPGAYMLTVTVTDSASRRADTEEIIRVLSGNASDADYLSVIRITHVDQPNEEACTSAQCFELTSDVDVEVDSILFSATHESSFPTLRPYPAGIISSEPFLTCEPYEGLLADDEHRGRAFGELGLTLTRGRASREEFFHFETTNPDRDSRCE